VPGDGNKDGPFRLPEDTRKGGFVGIGRDEFFACRSSVKRRYAPESHAKSHEERRGGISIEGHICQGVGRTVCVLEVARSFEMRKERRKIKISMFWCLGDISNNNEKKKRSKTYSQKPRRLARKKRKYFSLLRRERASGREDFKIACGNEKIPTHRSIQGFILKKPSLKLRRALLWSQKETIDAKRRSITSFN